MYGKLNDLPELAAAAGLKTAGIAPVEPGAGLLSRLQRRSREGRVSPFEEKDPMIRLAPERLLPGCRSIVVIGLPHGAPVKTTPPDEPGPRGEVARCSAGLDYHQLLKERAERLLKLIERELPGPLRGRILSDRSPLVERELARLAGLGWIGENCTLITPDSGSYIALGTILLDRELAPDRPLAESCLQCGRCREACPTGALQEPHVIDPYRCLSYITQAPGVIPPAVRPLLGGRLYGCDRCQEACPQNRLPLSIPAVVAAPARGVALLPTRPLLIPLLGMTRQEFNRTVGQTAAGWRGRSILQRNAVVALGNSGRSEAVPALAGILQNDPRPLLRLHAAWALGRLGGAKARRHLERQWHREDESAVSAELRAALEFSGP